MATFTCQEIFLLVKRDFAVFVASLLVYISCYQEQSFKKTGRTHMTTYIFFHRCSENNPFVKYKYANFAHYCKQLLIK